MEKTTQTTIGILIMRYLLAMVWLSEGFAKLFKRDYTFGDSDFNELLGQMKWMRDSNPLHFVSDILSNFLIPNFRIIVVIVIISELAIGCSLFFGLFTRAGSIIAAGYTIVLWLFTLGWGEWVWTYPLIFFPHILFFLSRSGRDFGLDRFIANKPSRKFLNLLT